MILHLPRRLPLSSRAPVRDPPDRGEPTRAVTHRPRTTGIRAELRPHDTPTLLSRTDFSPLILARVFPLRLNTDQSRRPTASTTYSSLSLRSLCRTRVLLPSLLENLPHFRPSSRAPLSPASRNHDAREIHGAYSSSSLEGSGRLIQGDLI